MNQKEFAKLLGVSQGKYSKWETQREQPNLENALKISYKLNIPVNDFTELASE